MGAAGQASGYEIDQSIRFNDGDSPYLNRTFGTPTSNSQFGYSFWIKLGEGYDGKYIISANGGGNNDNFTFSSNKLRIQEGGVLRLQSNQLFRDFSSWYHFVVAYDLGNATASQKLRVYLNGSEITSWATDTRSSLSSTSSRLNAAVSHDVGANVFNGISSHINNWDGYIAEFHFVDGAVLTPTDFGEYNDAGVWIPIEASPTYGNNGFYITGETASDLGEDFSGNSNDFTSSGLTTTDQMLDTPTDNYCVLSPIDKSSAITTSDGNLVVSNASTNSWNHGRGTLFAPSGKWYYEWIPTAGSYAEAGWMLNVSDNDYVEEESDVATTYYRGVGAAGRGFYIGSGSADTGPANFSLNDVVMMAIDVDTMKMWVGVNGTWYNSGDPAAGSNATGTWTAAIGESVAPWYGCFNGTTESFNFGQRPFAHTIPTGFNSWNTANLPTPSITDGSAHFQPTLYTGDGSSSHEINQTGNSTFEPSMVWIKSRSAATLHVIQDQVRGDFVLYPNLTNAEGATGGGWVKSFDSDGFTTDVNVEINDSGETFVGWQWKAAGSGSSNTDGSITSTVSTNTTAGFSIVTYVGNSTSGATVGHGLGAVPKMMILKDRDVGENWVIYNEVLGPTKFMYFTTDAAFTASNRWNDTAPTSSVFTLGNETQVNATGRDYVVYCFAEIPGYSSFGSYTGNGSNDGPFVYTGFKPKWIMYKSSSNSGTRWGILDTDRSVSGGGNSVGNQLFAELTSAEATADHEIDFLSNGFKVRDTSTSVNGNGYTITYRAFAEHPFGGDGAAPTTAR